MRLIILLLLGIKINNRACIRIVNYDSTMVFVCYTLLQLLLDRQGLFFYDIDNNLVEFLMLNNVRTVGTHFLSSYNSFLLRIGAVKSTG